MPDSGLKPVFTTVGLISAFVGLTAASQLAYREWLGVGCGPVGTCVKVQQSPIAHPLGISLALWGCFYYLGLVILWVLSGEKRNWRSSVLKFVCGLGMAASVGLTIYSVFVIRGVCPYCLVSGIAACCGFIASLLIQNEKPLRLRFTSLLIASFVLLNAVLFFVGNSDSVKLSMRVAKIPGSLLLDGGILTWNREHGKPVLVVFVDMDCSHCQKSIRMLRQQSRASYGVLVRHQPLRGRSERLALTAETGGLQVLDMVISEGAKLRLSSHRSRVQVLEDRVLAGQLGIKSVPLFVLVDRDGKARRLRPAEVMSL